MSVENFIDPERAAKDTAINDGDLNGEFMKQAGLVYFYSSNVAKAERQVSTIKLRLEMKEAEIATQVREDAAAAGTKITEKGIEAAVSAHKDVAGLKARLIQAQEVLTVAKGVAEAMRHKRDMLVMRGHMDRDELKARIAVEGGALASGLGDRRAAVSERLAKISND